MAFDPGDYLAENYRALVAAGHRTWAQIADMFAAEGADAHSEWARQQAPKVETAAVKPPESATLKPAARTPSK